MIIVKKTYLGIAVAVAMMLSAPTVLAQNADADEPWEFVGSSDGSDAIARHETSAVVANNRLYLIGGRGLKPVNEYNPITRSWQALSNTPIEMHHFQPVLLNGSVYLVGGFECCYPNEPSLTNIHIYDPAADSWSVGPAIPQARRRGGNAAVERNGKIYILGGNTLGHNGGAVAWFDEYDPLTNIWTTLPDAPNARDHFAAVIINDKLVAAGGRQSDIPNVFDKTVTAVDVYDFQTGQWNSSAPDIPTERAGAMVIPFGSEAIVVGGEVSGNPDALDVVEAYDVDSEQWRTLQPMQQGRHSGGAGLIADELHVIAGSGSRGGGNDITAHEVLDLSPNAAPADTDNDGLTDDSELNVHETDPELADTDEDDLEDGQEVLFHLTNPLSADSDGDGLDDGIEVTLESDPLDKDSDNDGLEDGFEHFTSETDLLDADTDGDLLNDSEEILVHSTNPLLADSDGDQLTDKHELEIGTNPNSNDSDNDSINDFDEIYQYETSALMVDTDLDGLDDALEISTYFTDATKSDSDSDGVLDGKEVNLGFNPLLSDSDSDGIDDATEIAMLEQGTGTDGETTAGTTAGTTTSGETTVGQTTDGLTTDGETTSGETTDGNAEQGSGGGGAVLWLLMLVVLRKVRNVSRSVV